MPSPMKLAETDAPSAATFLAVRHGLQKRGSAEGCKRTGQLLNLIDEANVGRGFRFVPEVVLCMLMRQLSNVSSSHT